jgi:hypothetical protein
VRLELRPRRRLLVVVAAITALTVSAVAAADNVEDDVVDSSGVVTGAPGGSADVAWRVHETGNDGCSATEATPVSVGIAPSGPVSASTTSLTFTSCDTWQSVTFTIAGDAASGDYTVTVTPSAGVGGGDPVTIRVPASEPPPPPADTTAPVLTVPADQTVEATSSAGAGHTFGASATDDVDGNVAATCTPASGSTFALGSTGVTCTATDTAGNTGSASFTVTVQDTTPPALSIPAAITAGATSAAGAVVSYSATAADLVDGSVTPACAPASGSTFPIGTTSVSCSAADTRGNRSAGSFTVTVTNSGPTVIVPPTHTVAAFDAAGAVVNFVPQPTASDVQDGPLVPTCSPPSGSRFPLGTTTVKCTATDSGGLEGSASFDVVVRDLTPPVVTPPRDVVVITDAPLPRGDARVAQFLAAASAADNVAVVALESNAPGVLPLGVTVVTFTALDRGGNTGVATATIELRPPAPGQPTPPVAPPPPARVPPKNVGELRVLPLDRAVRLEWRAAPNANRYVVTRSDRAGTTRQVYDGRATAVLDRGLVNGQEYRYVVVSYDAEGLRSVGVAVVAVPRRPVLLSPRYGAGVSRPPLLTWRAVARASYYNVQLFRVAADGTRNKVLTTWPLTRQLQLRRSWRYGGRTQRLTAGAYEWYVWAGFGARAAQNYGPLLGWSRFNVRPATR